MNLGVGGFERITSQLRCLKDRGNYFTARCPAHDDKRESLQVTPHDNGMIGVYCHAGCTFAEVMTALGLPQSAACADHIQTTRSTMNKIGQTGARNDKVRSSSPTQFTAEYLYRDAAGQVQGRAVRYEPKSFRQHASDGHGGFLPDMNGKQMPLYRLPELLATPDATVYLVEGEKDADALAALGLVATTNIGGAKAWRPDYVEPLQGRDVVILPDHDGSGKAWANQAAKSLNGNAARVRVVELPNLDEKGDVSDWLLAGGTRIDLETLIGQVSIYRPEQDDDSNEPWPDPIPLNDFPRPAFPTELLPRVPRLFVEEVAAETQTPHDIAALYTLTTYATVIARRSIVKIRDGWLEPVNLWTLSTYHSGGGKTPVFRKAAQPIWTIERHLAERMGPIVAERNSERTMRLNAIRTLEVALGKAHAGTTNRATTKPITSGETAPIETAAAMRERLEKLRTELRDLPELFIPALALDDVTPEALALEMSRNGERIAVIAAEGDAFNNMAGTYSDNSARLAVYLKGHAGESVRFTRIGREPVYLREPALTMGFSIQPGILEDLGRNRKFRATGLLARFLKAVPHSEPGYRLSCIIPVSAATSAAYADQIEWLHAHTESMGTDDAPKQITLSDGARAVLLIDFYEEVEIQKRAGNRLNHHLEWAGKLVGHTARIAALFHASECADEGVLPELRPISEEIMQRAIQLSREYWIPHELAAAGDMVADPAHILAGRIVSMFRRTGLVEATRRDIHHIVDSTIKGDALGTALDVLIDRGYIRQKPAPDSTQRTPGRKPSPTYEVNPQFMQIACTEFTESPRDPNSVHSVQENPAQTQDKPTPQASPKMMPLFREGMSNAREY